MEAFPSTDVSIKSVANWFRLHGAKNRHRLHLPHYTLQRVWDSSLLADLLQNKSSTDVESFLEVLAAISSSNYHRVDVAAVLSTTCRLISFDSSQRTLRATKTVVVNILTTVREDTLPLAELGRLYTRLVDIYKSCSMDRASGAVCILLSFLICRYECRLPNSMLFAENDLQPFIVGKIERFCASSTGSVEEVCDLLQVIQNLQDKVKDNTKPITRRVMASLCSYYGNSNQVLQKLSIRVMKFIENNLATVVDTGILAHNQEGFLKILKCSFQVSPGGKGHNRSKGSANCAIVNKVVSLLSEDTQDSTSTRRREVVEQFLKRVSDLLIDEVCAFSSISSEICVLVHLLSTLQLSNEGRLKVVKHLSLLVEQGFHRFPSDALFQNICLLLKYMSCIVQERGTTSDQSTQALNSLRSQLFMACSLLNSTERKSIVRGSEGSLATTIVNLCSIDISLDYCCFFDWSKFNVSYTRLWKCLYGILEQKQKEDFVEDSLYSIAESLRMNSRKALKWMRVVLSVQCDLKEDLFMHLWSLLLNLGTTENNIRNSVDQLESIRLLLAKKSEISMFMLLKKEVSNPFIYSRLIFLLSIKELRITYHMDCIEHAFRNISQSSSLGGDAIVFLEELLNNIPSCSNEIPRVWEFASGRILQGIRGDVWSDNLRERALLLYGVVSSTLRETEQCGGSEGAKGFNNEIEVLFEIPCCSARVPSAHLFSSIAKELLSGSISACVPLLRQLLHEVHLKDWTEFVILISKMNIDISEDAMGQLESLLSEFGTKMCSATNETRTRLLKSVMSLVTLRNERFIGPICSAFLEACVPSSGVIKRERLNSNSPRLSEHARHQSMESFFRVLGTCSLVSQSLILNHCQSKMRRLPKEFIQANYSSILERFVEKLCATDRDMYGNIGLRALFGLLMHDGNPANHMQLMDRDVAWKISDILKVFLSEADQYDLKASRQSVSSFLHSFNKLKEISVDAGLGLDSEKKARITKECDRLYNSILKRLVSCGVHIDSEDQRWRCDSPSMAPAAVVSFIVGSVSEEDFEKCVGIILPVLHQVSLLSTEHWSKVSSAISSIFEKNQREDSKISLARMLWRQSRDRADVIRWEELFIRVNCTFSDQLFKALLSAVLHFRSVVLYNFLVKRTLESNLEQYDNKARLACFVKCSKMLLKVISSSAVLTMCSLLRDILWSVPGDRSLEYFYRIFLPILQNVKVNRQFVQFGVELSGMWTDKRNFDPAHSCKLLMVIESLDVCIQRIPRSTIARGIEGAFSGLKKDLVLGCRSIISCKREFPLRKQLVCAAFRLHCHVFYRWPEKGGSRLASALSAPCILKTCSLFEWNWQFDEENKANLSVENSSHSVDSDEAFFDFTLPRQPLREGEEREITVTEGGGFQYLKSAADVAVKLIDSYYEDGQQLSSWTDSLVEILSEKQKFKCAQLFVIYALTTSKKRVLLNSEQISVLWKCLHRNADLELSSSFVKVLMRLVDSKILRTEHLEQMCTFVIERFKKSKMTALGKSEVLLRKILAASTLSEKFMKSTVNSLLQYAVSESISEDARVIALEVLRVLLSGSYGSNGVLFECVPPQRLLELYSTVKRQKLRPLLLNIVGYAIGEQKLSVEDVLQVTGTVEFPNSMEVHIYLSCGAPSCLLRHLDQILTTPDLLKRKDVMEILEQLVGQGLIANTEVVLNEILGLRQFEDPDAYVRLIVALLSRTNSTDEVKFKSWIEENMANQQLMGNLCSRLETVISDDLSERVSSKVVLLFLLVVLCESDSEDVKCSLLSLLRKVVEKLSLDEMEIYSGICDIDGVPLTRKALLILEARRIIEGNEIIHKMECTVVQESIQLSCLTDTQLTQSSHAHSVTESIISVESITDTIRVEEWEDLEDDQEEEKEEMGRNDRKERKESSRVDVVIDLLRTNSPTAILIAATVLESEGLLKKCKKFHNFDEMIFFLKNRRISAEFPWEVLLDEACRSGRMSEVVEAVKYLDCRPLNVDIDYHRKRLTFVSGLVSADVQTEIMDKWKGNLNLWISEFESLSSPFDRQFMVRSLRVYLDDLLLKSPGTFYLEFHPQWKSACSQLIDKYNRDEIVFQLGPHFFLWFCDPQNEDSSLRSACEFWLRWKELLMKAVHSSAASSAWKHDVSFLTYSRFLFIDGNVTTFLREKLALVRDEVLQKYVVCVLKSRLWLTSQSVDEVEENAELVRKLMESL